MKRKTEEERQTKTEAKRHGQDMFALMSAIVEVVLVMALSHCV